MKCGGVIQELMHRRLPAGSIEHFETEPRPATLPSVFTGNKTKLTCFFHIYWSFFRRIIAFSPYSLSSLVISHPLDWFCFAPKRWFLSIFHSISIAYCAYTWKLFKITLRKGASSKNQRQHYSFFYFTKSKPFCLFQKAVSLQKCFPICLKLFF